MKKRNKPFFESCAVAGLIAIASISVEAGSYEHQDGIQAPAGVSNSDFSFRQHQNQDGIQAPEASNINRFATVTGKYVHQDGINPIAVESDREITN